MNRYEFSLLLDGVREITDGMADALHDAGCSDGMIVRQAGGHAHCGVRCNRPARRRGAG
jgi:hypothetical protein